MPRSTRPRCGAKNRHGDPCLCRATRDSEFCYVHTPGSGFKPLTKAGPGRWKAVNRLLGLLMDEPTPEIVEECRRHPVLGPRIARLLDAHEYGRSKDGDVIAYEDKPDHNARADEAEKLMAWRYARPKQSLGIEHSGPGGGPIVGVQVRTDAERALDVAKILAEAGVLDQADEA